MEEKHSGGARDQDYRQGARNRKVFTTDDDIFGLPSRIAIMGGFIVLATFFVFHLWTAVIAAALYFPPMFAIHKDDPRAVALWRDVLIERHAGWEAGVATRRELILLSRDDHNNSR